MFHTHSLATPGKSTLLAAVILTPAILGSASTDTVSSAAPSSYKTVDLVADLPRVARNKDPNLVNAWGLALTLDGVSFVADNGTGHVSLIKPDGSVTPFEIKIPATQGTSAPTGVVLDPTGSFLVSHGGLLSPPSAIFSTEEGTLAAWIPGMTVARIVADESMRGAIYKGLARGHEGPAARLYATDFANGSVDMFDAAFQRIERPGAFVDPNVPAGYAPFGIQNVEDQLIVTYAQRARPDGDDDEPGPGHGFVSIFAMNGDFLRQIAAHGALNSPWGIAAAPRHFGSFSSALLVGNFGDGRINAYDRQTGAFLGTLSDERGSPLAVEGLWGLAFRPDPDHAVGQPGPDDRNPRLYFTAGPGHEDHGLFGFVSVVQP